MYSIQEKEISIIPSKKCVLSRGFADLLSTILLLNNGVSVPESGDHWIYQYRDELSTVWNVFYLKNDWWSVFSWNITDGKCDIFK